MKTFGVITLVLAVSAVPVSAQSLVGTWRFTPNENTAVVFSFTAEGTGTWSMDIGGDPGFSDSFEFKVLVNYDTDPFRLDITDVDHGFLAGKIMYGIFRLEGDDVMFLDFKPGEIDADPAALRPADFTNDTVRLERVVGEDNGH